MFDFRHFAELLDRNGEVLHVHREVDPCFELPALLKQAEGRGNAIRFHAVKGSPFSVMGGLLTSAERFARSLGIDNPAAYTKQDHETLIFEALEHTGEVREIPGAPCKQHVLTGGDAALTTIPVPTFFEDDSGPFITAAVGISRNPDNGIINAGFYRILVLGPDKVAVSAGPTSDLRRFLNRAAEAEQRMPVVLAIGAEPALLMAASSKTPGDKSELEVAAVLQREPFEVAPAECSDLVVPAHAEFIIEVDADPNEPCDNQMGEFGDLYGITEAVVADVVAVTHRDEPVFHAIMAGAGKEHNTIGMIILYEVEPEMKRQLVDEFDGISDVVVLFEPPRMTTFGDVYVAVSNGRQIPSQQLYDFVYSRICGRYPAARVIRRVVLLDDDIDLRSAQQIDWAIAARATEAGDFWASNEVPNTGGLVRLGIDARARDPLAQKRPHTPGSDDLQLDDYL